MRPSVRKQRIWEQSAASRHRVCMSAQVCHWKMLEETLGLAPRMRNGQWSVWCLTDLDMFLSLSQWRPSLGRGVDVIRLLITQVQSSTREMFQTLKFSRRCSAVTRNVLLTPFIYWNFRTSNSVFAPVTAFIWVFRVMCNTTQPFLIINLIWVKPSVRPQLTERSEETENIDLNK